MKTIHVAAGKPYDVLIGQNLLEKSGELISQNVKKPYTKFAVITDDNVAPIYLERITDALIDGENEAVKVVSFTFPNGEQSKNLATVEKIYAFLAKNEIGRNDCIIALGGGVTGDMAGFAAATYLRGVDYVQIPTTLLAQVDSSVGGKTAVDLPQGKNLVGAFKQPVLVIIDTETLKTLPEHFFTDGLGEVIKYGMIRSERILTYLESHDKDTIHSVIPDIVEECIDVKRRIVEADEFESGELKLLNFGHTFGHAIEKLENYSGMTHGFAVTAGMLFISRMYNETGLVPNEIIGRLAKLMMKYSLFSAFSFTDSQLFDAALSDKKRSGDSIDLIIVKKVGEGEILRQKLDDLRKMCE
jgi:3-dehydroquinate synthase